MRSVKQFTGTRNAQTSEEQVSSPNFIHMSANGERTSIRLLIL
jgi:hypothetical protein